MGTVTKLPTILERGPHLAGEAFCIQCKHKWVAVAPSGTVDLECPSCHTMKGLLKYPCEPENSAWVCYCGCHVFMISELTNIICWNCGVI